MAKKTPISPTISAPVVVSYARYSSTAQTGGTSIARQIEDGERWAKANGLTVDSSLRDEGVSAFRGTNATTGALASILGKIDSGKIPSGSTLIVESLDRLSRNAISEALEMFLSIINRGVTIVTLMDQQKYAKGCNLQQLMYSLMIMATAHEESAKKSSRSKDNWNRRREAAKKGELLTKKLPAWLRLVDGKIQLDKAKSATVKYIFELGLKGFGIGAIVRRLNEEGVKPLVEGQQWYTRYVQRLFTEGAVIGIKQVKKFEGKKRVIVDSIPDYYPAVVDAKDYERVQALCSGRRNRTYQAQTTKAGFVNLFSGILKDEDGHSFTTFRRPMSKRKDGSVGRKEHRYLITMGAWSKRAKAGVYLRQDLFELAFFEVMNNKFFEAFLVDEGNANSTTAKRVAIDLQSELDGLQKRTAELEEQLVSSSNPPAALLRALEKIEARTKEVQKELQVVQSDSVLTTADQIDASLERMRELLTGEADDNVRTEIGGIIGQLVSSIRLKVWTKDNLVIGDAKIEARNGETIPFIFAYPHKAKLTEAQMIASLDVRY